MLGLAPVLAYPAWRE